MDETRALNLRSDLEILADVDAIIADYPPLNNDRLHVRTEVISGQVIATGHVKTINTRSFLLNSLTRVTSVTGVDADFLFVDDVIRYDVGRFVPVGVSVSVEYGTVVLSGTMPQGADIEAMIAKIGTVPGVMKVVTALRV